MKKCPQCKSVYTDDTLAFCLADGTSLENSGTSAETLVLPQAAVTEVKLADVTAPSIRTETMQRHVETDRDAKGVSKFWIVSTVSLLLLLVAVGVSAILFSGFLQQSDTAAVNDPTPQPTLTPRSSGIGQEGAFSPKPTPIPASPREPVTYKVHKIAENDVLYIRPAPGNLKSHLGTIPPNGSGIIVTGEGVRSGKSLWYPVIYNGIKGWVSGNFIMKE